MTFRDITSKTGKLVSDNSPAILTAIGVTGLLTTAYLTGKASFKAADIIEDEKNHRGRIIPEDRDDMFTNKEMFQLLWKLYLPAATSAVLTASCMIGANRIGASRAAAMTTAYAISQRAYNEYEHKVVEMIGKNKEQKVRDSVAQDRVSNNPVDKQQVIVTGGGEVLCYDLYTGRYFQSSMETLKKAQNDLNHTVLNHQYASLTDFYSKIGLSSTKSSDDVGWNSDKLLELRFSATMSDDERPCITVDFVVAPIRNFFSVH